MAEQASSFLVVLWLKVICIHFIDESLKKIESCGKW